MARRHRLAAHTLVIFDAPLVPGPYAQRRQALIPYFELAPLDPRHLGAERVYLAPQLAGEMQGWWQQLQQANEQCQAGFYEGVVAKRADSLYPVQLRSPEQVFAFWCKHRWAW